MDTHGSLPPSSLDTPVFRVSVSALVRLKKEHVNKIVADVLCTFIAEEKRNEVQIWVANSFPLFLGNLRGMPLFGRNQEDILQSCALCWFLLGCAQHRCHPAAGLITLLDMLKIEYEFLKFWANDILMNGKIVPEVDRESVGSQLEALFERLRRPAAAAAPAPAPGGEAPPPPSSSN